MILQVSVQCQYVTAVVSRVNRKIGNYEILIDSHEKGSSSCELRLVDI